MCRGRIVVLLVMFVFSTMMRAQYMVTSPDQQVRVQLSVQRKKGYNSKFNEPYTKRIDVFYKGVRIVKGKELDITVKHKGHRLRFGKSSIQDIVNKTLQMDDNVEVNSTLAQMTGRYNSISLETDKNICLEVRVYDNGVTYRFSTKGLTDSYKILDMTKTFPNDMPVSILKTFDGDVTLPWNSLIIDRVNSAIDKSYARQDWDNSEMSSNGIVSWRDALSIFSAGASMSWYTGGLWQDVGLQGGASMDLIYKYIYMGVSVDPCAQIIYINYPNGYFPFVDKVAAHEYSNTTIDGERGVYRYGAIHSWNVAGKLGFSVPLQYRNHIWNISPYACVGYLQVKQHDQHVHLLKPMTTREHWIAGPGVKLSWTLPEHVTFGINYEYLLFLDGKGAKAKNSLGVSFGVMF